MISERHLPPCRRRHGAKNTRLLQTQRSSRSLPGSLVLCATTAAVLCLSWMGTTVEATISFIESGRTFHSKLDPHIGQQMMRGYEYMGRLQSVAENPTLCPGVYPNQKWNVVTPTDGLPVALIAQSGGCSVMEKAHVAANMINPPNNVGYVIIVEPSKRRGGYKNDNPFANKDTNNEYRMATIESSVDEENDGYDENNSQLIHSAQSLALELHSLVQSMAGNNDDSAFFVPKMSDLELFEAEQHGRALTQFTTEFTEELSDKTNPKNLEGPGDLPLAVLHVTYATGQVLLDIIANENPVDYRQGGLRILLNGKENDYSAHTIILWMLISFTFCLCGCCCLLFCVQTSFDEEQEQAAPRRPVRRRLTLDQVRTRFPSYHFNPVEHSQNNCCAGDCHATEASQQHNYMQLSDECTICLDEFEPGVRVRQLPCGHVFHSTCIARWLIERSAVCPLCKLDLYEEPEEEDDDDDSDVQQPQEPPALSFFGRLWSGATSNQGYARLEIPMGTPAETVVEGPVDPSGTAAAAAAVGDEEEETRAWWPFSLETVTSTDEEDHNAHNTTHRQRSSLASSAAGFFSLAYGNLFGSRPSVRRHEETGEGIYNNNGVLATELTEPLVSQGSSQQQQLEELRFIRSRPSSSSSLQDEPMDNNSNNNNTHQTDALAGPSVPTSAEI
mmetsp:Transcript_3693/g.8425  ORF Transcript_3693/g.8425 Transcript_3693/m.8425 type:complete len:672 (-) Transcript_3693:1405-3420(-)